MNANTFLTNISKSLHTLEDQNNSLSITSDKNELKLQEIHKSIINLTTLIQQQSNSINGRFELIEENVQQHPVKPNVFSTKSHKRKFKSVDDLLGESSESEAGNNSKLNPYDLTPTLVALVRNKMKVNERHDEDSDESIENEFSFDYSKSFTHRTNQKVLKAYLLFYMKDYESRGDNLKMVRQICNTYFGTRRNVFKSSPEKSKAIKINNRRNNRTLKKFNARNSVIDTFDVEILGHPIKEIKALFARELISPEISEDEATIKDKANDEISEEIYYVPSIPWRSNEAIKVRDIIDAKVKVEQQRQAKLRKGSVSGITTPNQRIPVSPNKDKFRQLVSFIPACPTSSNFPRWAIKKSYNLNTGIYNA
ncbi:15006_t:CDS:2, partial [Rhizophagus irregularis]